MSGTWKIIAAVIATALLTALVFNLKSEPINQLRMHDCLQKTGMGNPTETHRNTCEAIVKIQAKADKFKAKRIRVLKTLCQSGDAIYFDKGKPSVEIDNGVAIDHTVGTKMNCSTGLMIKQR